MLTTRHKVMVARVVSKLLLWLRRILRLDSEVIARRRGILWHLDLSEGIDLAVYLGIYELGLSRVARQYVRHGSVVLDIGANIGVHTLRFAEMVGPEGRVIAFEPTTFAFEKLQRNLTLNPELAERVVVHQLFLNDGKLGAAPDSVYASWPMSDVTDVHPILRGRKMDTEGASGVSLDSLLDSPGGIGFELNGVDFIKIDVDGNELGVLEGAVATIGRYKPPMVIEFAPYLHHDPVAWGRSWVEMIGRLGYVLRDSRSLSLIELSVGNLATIARDGASVDLVGTPSSLSSGLE